MTHAVIGLCLLIAGLGGLGMASPLRLLEVVRCVQTPSGLYAVSALRLLLGLGLVAVAPSSKAPELFRILGVLTVVAALMTPLVGLERWGRLVDWWWGMGSVVIRAWAAVPLALGLYLAWALFP